MALDLGGNKKKQNAKSKYSIVELSLFKPGKKKYAEFDYEEIRKKQLNEDDSSGDDERFHDREALEIVKRLEAKYGGKKDKKGRKLCFGTEDDYMDKRAGYDLDDDFIDDSEAYDELIPSTMDTVQGGFYVNRGKLEFKTKHEEVNDSDISDSDDTPQPKKGTKRSQTLSEDDVEVDEDVVPPVAGSATDDKTVSDTPVSIPTNPKPRMVGAPPSKVRRVALGESANQRAANAIKKRLVGMPPTILKRKVLPKLTSRKESEVPAFPRTISGEAIVPKINDKKKRPLAPMTDTLSNMIAEFKRCTNNLALPGQKKRLQNIHVDMVIAIEEQCLKDGYSVHEKARVAHSLADYCGIQKNSLYARCIKRRDEHKNGAPNLAFLPKSAVDGKGTSTISTSSSTKAINIASESSLTTKTAGTTTPIVAASKSTIVSANPVTVSPSPTRSNSPMPLPSTSVSSSSASSTVKASTAPVTSSIPTNTASNSDPSTSVKTSQSWTGQKKLAAQAMVTNLAALLPSSERLGDLQEVLRKVGNETMTYDDFLKWHDKSMKSVYARASVEKKNAVNGIARVSPSTSNVNKTTKCGSGASSELAVGTQCKNPTNVPSSLTKRVSLAQAVATAKIPPRGRPLSLTHVQISERLESDKQTTLQAIATAIDNSKVAYKKKCDVASATGKPAPRFDFLWTENLANALKVQIDLYWSVLLGSDSYAKLADNIFTVFAKEIFPYFRNEIKLSRLLIEYTRRNPEKAFILACPSAQKLLKDDNIDLSSSNFSIAVLAKKGKPVNDSVAAKTNPTTPYKPILPVRSSSFDEIQTTSSQDDPDVVVIEPSTSNATTSNDGAATGNFSSFPKSTFTGNVRVNMAASTPPSSSDAMSQVGAVLTQMGWSLPPAQLSELSFAMSNLTSITTDPHKLQALKEALLMQFASEYQLVSKKKQGAGKKKDGEDKKKTMEQEKEEKKRVKVERREELNAQKRVLAASAKEKAIEEKRLRLEEEKRQKLAEKARKEKEEREKRLEEQAERERLMREEREKLAKEAAEKQKKEEEERQRLEQTRIKIEQERAQELEKRRQAELREVVGLAPHSLSKEERKAAQLLEQEIRMEEVSQSDVTPDLMLVFEVNISNERNSCRYGFSPVTQ
uniref:HUN domain-containing protein n=1 Tax=Angiostrongylus cantonensis TaxID=6313 RepID=A0A158P9Z4_ANGCA